MDQQTLIFLLIVIANLNRNKENNQLHMVTDYIKNVKVDPLYTAQKIKAAKKITPYIPEEYNPLYVKSIIITEKIVKLLELVEFMNITEDNYKTNTIPIDNNKERINKIVATIQEEIPKSKVHDLGMVMDLIVNMDKYKNIFGMMTNFMNNPDMLKDSNGMMKLMESLMKSSSMDQDKIKEMTKMMEIFKVINAPKKEKSIEVKKTNE